jgi:hypothetical protein
MPPGPAILREYLRLSGILYVTPGLTKLEPDHLLGKIVSTRPSGA